MSSIEDRCRMYRTVLSSGPRSSLTPFPAPQTRVRGLRRRKALPAVGAGAVAVVAVLGLAGLVAPGRADPVATAQPRPPAAVAAAARALLEAVEPGYTVTGPAEWVRTTRRAYERLGGYRGSGPDEELYVVQVRGQFTCAACPRPWGAKVLTGSAVGSGFPVHSQGETSVSIGSPVDLSRLGTVHTFPVS